MSATGESTQSLLSKKIAVPSVGLSAELKKIRENTAKDDGREDGVEVGAQDPRVRATLSNLILLVSKGCSSFDSDAVESLITELCVAHPSRFFVVEYGTENGDAEVLSTAVSSRCVFANSGVKVCSEEVYVAADSENVDLVPNLLLSMLVPDIDVVLLVLGDPAKDFCTTSQVEEQKGFRELLCGLYGVSDIVMFDSSLFENYSKSKSVLSSQVEGKESSDSTDAHSRAVTEIRKKDVNWNRTARWRDLLAEQFDVTHDLRVAKHVSSITFSCVGTCEDFKEGRLPSDAILLAGWASACLGWEPGAYSYDESKNVLTLAMKEASGSSAEVCFEPFAVDSEYDNRSRLRKIVMSMESGEDKMQVTLSRQVEENLVEISTAISALGSGNAESCDLILRKAPFPVETVVQMLSAGVASSDSDHGYVLARSLAGKISSSFS